MNNNSNIENNFDLNISLIGNKIIVTSFLNNFSNKKIFSYISEDINNLEIANYRGTVKIKYEKEYIPFENQKKSITVNFRKQKDCELKEYKELLVNIKLFTTCQNYFRYTKRNLVTPSINDKTNGIIYLIDAILDKKNINHFKKTYFLNNDIIIKNKLKVYIVLNRFKDLENNNNNLIKIDIMNIINNNKDIEPIVADLDFPIDYDDEFELNNNYLNNNNNKLENKKNFDNFIDNFLATIFDFKKLNPLYVKEKIIILGNIEYLIDFIKNVYNESENVSYFYLKKLLIERYIIKNNLIFNSNKIIYLGNLFFDIKYFNFQILQNLSDIKIIILLIDVLKINKEKNIILKIFYDYIYYLKYEESKNNKINVKIIFLLNKKNKEENLKNNIYNIVKDLDIDYNYDFDYLEIYNNKNFEDKIINILENQHINNSIKKKKINNINFDDFENI